MPHHTGDVVEGTSEPWTPADHSTARLIGDAVSEVILQFRSVQMLIAQNQLKEVSREVQISDQPLVIIDATGSRFREGLLERRQITTIRLIQAPIYLQGLLSSLIESAQLAALEITHSCEVETCRKCSKRCACLSRGRRTCSNH